MSPQMSKDHFDLQSWTRVLRATAGAKHAPRGDEAAALEMIQAFMLKVNVVEPPIDLRAVAAAAGVSEVRVVPLAINGQLLLEGEHLVIEVNRADDPWSRELTLAHEIAHVILESPRIEASRLSGNSTARRVSTELVERLCNLCAEELLLPLGWLRRSLAGRKATLVDILRTASVARTPVAFAAARLLRLDASGWQLVWISRLGEGVEVTASVPVRPDTDFANVRVIGSGLALAKSALSASGAVAGRMTLQFHDHALHYSAECIRTDADAVVCFLR